MKKLAMLSVLLVAGTCFAGTAALSLEVDQVAKTYRVYGTVAGEDNQGLDSFKFQVNFSGGVNWATQSVVVGEDEETGDPIYGDVAGLVKAPKSAYNGTPAGFCDFVSAVGAGTSVTYTAGQPSLGTSSTVVLRNVGILAGSRTTASWNPTVAWAAPVLLAEGTYAGDNGFVSLSVPINQTNQKPSFTLLAKVGTSWVGPGNISFTDSVSVSAPVQIGIPEPTTIGLLCLGLVGLIRRK